MKHRTKINTIEKSTMNQRVGCLKINKIDKPLNMLIKDKKRIFKLTKSNEK